MRRPVEIGLFTEDVVTARRFCGTELLVEQREYPWGGSAYLRDPDGRLLELSQH